MNRELLCERQIDQITNGRREGDEVAEWIFYIGVLIAFVAFSIAVICGMICFLLWIIDVHDGRFELIIGLSIWVFVLGIIAVLVGLLIDTGFFEVLFSFGKE